jgi:HK97 family phage prohead protease
VKGGDQLRRAVVCPPRSLNESRRTIEFVCSTADVDSYGTSIRQDWKLARFKRNPIALLHHDSRRPIGTWHDVGVRDGELLGTLCFASGAQDADAAWTLARQGVLRAVSVGFRLGQAIEKEGYTELRGCELYEISLVSIPANDKALARAAGERKMTKIERLRTLARSIVRDAGVDYATALLRARQERPDLRTDGARLVGTNDDDKRERKRVETIRALAKEIQEREGVDHFTALLRAREMRTDLR